ncbi:hypothetical protein AOLI_G00099920 [Acnodon oligacanthus]
MPDMFLKGPAINEYVVKVRQIWKQVSILMAQAAWPLEGSQRKALTPPFWADGCRQASLSRRHPHLPPVHHLLSP